MQEKTSVKAGPVSKKDALRIEKTASKRKKQPPPKYNAGGVLPSWPTG